MRSVRLLPYIGRPLPYTVKPLPYIRAVRHSIQPKIVEELSVVLDTNVFVAAAFDGSTSSGRIFEAVRAGRLRLVWADSTRAENERVLRKIPPIEWEPFENLFTEAGRCDDELDLGGVSYIPDPTDRKFAALSAATGAILISNDDHLLAQRDRGKTPILTPSEFWNRYGEELS